MHPGVKTCTQESSGTSLRDLGCGLLGAGSALLATGNKRLALALVASGVALCWKEGGKRPATKAIEQRPQKSPENEGGKGQKKLGKGGAAHLKDEDRAGTIKKEVSKLIRKDQEDVVVSRSPGLRALRLGDGRASHGTSSGAASSQGQDVAGPFPAGALFGDASGLMSQAQSDQQKVQDDEKRREELTKEANRRIKALEARVDTLVAENESYMASNPMPVPMASTRMVEDGMQRALVPPSRSHQECIKQWWVEMELGDLHQDYREQSWEVIHLHRGRELRQGMEQPRQLEVRQWPQRDHQDRSGEWNSISTVQQAMTGGIWVSYKKVGSSAVTAEPGKDDFIHYMDPCQCRQVSWMVWGSRRGSSVEVELMCSKITGPTRIGPGIMPLGVDTLSSSSKRLRWVMTGHLNVLTHEALSLGFWSTSPKGGVCWACQDDTHMRSVPSAWSLYPKAFSLSGSKRIVCLLHNKHF